MSRVETQQQQQHNNIEGLRSCTTHKDYFSRFRPEHEMLSSKVKIWLALTYTHKHTFVLSLSLSLSLKHTHTHTHTHMNSLYFSLTCTFLLSLSLSHTHTHTHTLSLNVVRLHTDLEFKILLQKKTFSETIPTQQESKFQTT